jgi:hypothetical protein
MHLWYLAQHRLKIGIVGRESGNWQSGEGGACKRTLDEISTIKRATARVSQCVPQWPNKDGYRLIGLTLDSRKRTIRFLSKDIISICYLQASNFSPGGSEVRPLYRSSIAYPETGTWQVT